MTKRIFKVAGCFLLVLLMAFSATACRKSPNRYTTEQHIQRITKRLDGRFKNWVYEDGSRFTDFEVYPLYDENEELKYFLIEFEPYGFIFVELRHEESIVFSWLGFRRSMYGLSTIYGEDDWSPYTIDETTGERLWIVDENGEKISYSKSPYSVTQNEDERKYLLRSNRSAEYICAVKNGETFINLIGGNEIDVSNGDLQKNQPTLYIGFIAHKRFDL